MANALRSPQLFGLGAFIENWGEVLAIALRYDYLASIFNSKSLC